MKKITKITAFAVLVMGVAALLQPVNASCPDPRVFRSGSSYVYTEGCGTNGCDLIPGGTSMTANATGVFWALGQGDPAPALGVDNGAFPFIGDAVRNWGYVYAPGGYPVSFSQNWAGDGRIDGCIDDFFGTCMAVLLLDTTEAGKGAFALMTAAPDANRNYSFQQGAGDPIILSEITTLAIGPASIVGDAASGSFTVDAPGVSAGDIGGSVYPDPACDPAKGAGSVTGVLGWQLFQAETPSGAGAPDADSPLWVAISDVTPLGTPAMGNGTCSLGGDLYIAQGLVFDSTYKTTFVGGNPTPVNCNSNLADPNDIERKPRNREAPRSRSRGR